MNDTNKQTNIDYLVENIAMIWMVDKENNLTNNGILYSYKLYTNTHTHTI